MSVEQTVSAFGMKIIHVIASVAKAYKHQRQK